MDSDLSLTPMSAAVATLIATLILLLPRRMAILPLLAAACFLPIGQSLQIAGLHFYLLRLMLLVSLSRVLIRGELVSIWWCRVDVLVFCLVAVLLGIGSLNGPGWATFITRGGHHV